MSDAIERMTDKTIDMHDLLADRGTLFSADSYIIAALFDRSGDTACFALADGTLRLLPRDATEWRTIEAHKGGVLCLAADTGKTGFITGGDDGRLLRIAPTGEITELASFGRKWVEQVAVTPQSGGLIACAVGKSVHLLRPDGAPFRVLEHPSTATGIAFDSKGKRVAVSHYNGASLWFVNSATAAAKFLEWKGSHTGVAFHPDGDAVITAMQENALHGWRLSDGQHMRMSGYPAKTESLSFTKNGKYLASSGADAIVLWPFFGGGPIGKPPVERADRPGKICTRVAAHPMVEMIAAGFADGSVVLSEPTTDRLVIVAMPEETRGEISGLSWSPDGAALLIGSENGFAASVNLQSRG